MEHNPGDPQSLEERQDAIDRILSTIEEQIAAVAAGDPKPHTS